MSGEMSGDPPRNLNMKEKFDRWYALSSWPDGGVHLANVVTAGWLMMGGEDCKSPMHVHTCALLTSSDSLRYLLWCMFYCL